jgi:hypothetical protein
MPAMKFEEAVEKNGERDWDYEQDGDCRQRILTWIHVSSLVAHHVLYLQPEWPRTNRSSREIKELRRSNSARCQIPCHCQPVFWRFGLFTAYYCLAMGPSATQPLGMVGGLTWRQDESVILAGNRSRCGCTARMGHYRLRKSPNNSPCDAPKPLFLHGCWYQGIGASLRPCPGILSLMGISRPLE